MKNSESFKKFLPDLIVIAAFILVSFIYFVPAVLDGRVVVQHDSLAAIGQGQEQRDYMERHDGERTRWNLSMFAGMPSYQMSPTYDSSKPQDAAKKAYSLFLPNYVQLLFIMLLGFYILMRAFKASPLLSGLGAVIWAFSSYFFILIAAGHIWKFVTLAYIPPTIAGMVYAYRGKYLLGGLLFTVFTAFQISSNHFQMSYYFLFVMLFIGIAFLVEAVRKKELPGFLRSTGVLLVAGIIGIAANASSLYHTYEYSKETMRGGSELTRHVENSVTSDGLERDYITAWSYGIGETWTLLVPNTKGGASVPLSENERAMNKARPEYREIYQQIGQYWGEQPGTSGPVYVGAFVLSLFILGLFIVKGPMKWPLLAGTIFSILLSWGKNFMGLTDFFIDHVPMYNKFRAVSSILVVAEFCIPLLAALAVKVIEQERKRGIILNEYQYNQPAYDTDKRCFGIYPRKENSKDEQCPQPTGEQTQESVELVPQRSDVPGGQHQRHPQSQQAAQDARPTGYLQPRGKGALRENCLEEVGSDHGRRRVDVGREGGHGRREDGRYQQPREPGRHLRHDELWEYRVDIGVGDRHAGGVVGVERE